MPLEPALAAKLHLMADIDFHNLDADALARMDEFYRDDEPWSAPSGVEITDAVAPGPHGDVPVRVYRAAAPSRRALVWAHGGGFASGDLDMGEAHVVAAELCARSGATVISVGYRLATEDVRYPIPVDDVAAAWRWAAALEPSGGFEGVALGGASAGGALALSAGLRLRDERETRFDGLYLAYPFVHFPNPGLDPAVAAELAVLPPSMRFPAANVEWMVRNYVGRITDLPAAAMPGSAHLNGLPPVRIVVSEYDDLRSSAELLERQLRDVDVEVVSHLASGMTHGHMNRFPVYLPVEESLAFFADGLR